ncbi:uncharacterized protein LOC124164532 [Ischnura elegans]|uniref:uncharacterized protein LOC124164532 n=1 Tax=Ischnura elegans TaxID=197161 RepID=UPI001ED87319|nr:uncharacterized protein LOC124164532 [Ischnura elegans]
MALYPVWFFVVAFFYVAFRFFYLYYCSPDRGRYREITKESYNTLWMVYRFFITPYNLNIWCIDTYDDVFYHLETFVLALYWPFPLDCGHPLADYRWIITATILSLNFIALPLLLKLNEAMFENSPLCEDHDPFPIRLSIRKDLKAGKTAVERLFGSTGGALDRHPGT